MNNDEVELNSVFDNIDIKNGKDKSLLYVGVNSSRAFLFNELKECGYKIDILEISKVNVYDFMGRMFGTYNKLIQGDVCDIDTLVSQKYDVVFWWHGPEHIKKEMFEPTIRKIEAVGSLIILGCPYGSSKQGPVDGNIHETHLWNVYPKYFKQLGYKTLTINRDVGGKHITAWRKI